MAAPAVSATALPLLANGDFGLGALNWELRGDARVVGGAGLLGEAGCADSEGTLVAGKLITLQQVPLVPGARLAFDDAITTADVFPYDSLRVVLVGADGSHVGLDQFNPNEALGVCGTFAGHREVAVPAGYLLPAARVEFHVWEDGAGDPLDVAVDDVHIEV